MEKCLVCKSADATVVVTAFVHRKCYVLNFCYPCAVEKRLPLPGSGSVHGVERGKRMSVGQRRRTACPSCGYTYREFRRWKLLGCPDCYSSLGPLLEPYLSRVHRTLLHRGKSPARLHVTDRSTSEKQEARRETEKA